MWITVSYGRRVSSSLSAVSLSNYCSDGEVQDSWNILTMGILISDIKLIKDSSEDRTFTNILAIKCISLISLLMTFLFISTCLARPVPGYQSRPVPNLSSRVACCALLLFSHSDINYNSNWSFQDVTLLHWLDLHMPSILYLPQYRLCIQRGKYQQTKRMRKSRGIT